MQTIVAETTKPPAYPFIISSCQRAQTKQAVRQITGDPSSLAFEAVPWAGAFGARPTRSLSPASFGEGLSRSSCAPLQADSSAGGKSAPIACIHWPAGPSRGPALPAATATQASVSRRPPRAIPSGRPVREGPRQGCTRKPGPAHPAGSRRRANRGAAPSQAKAKARSRTRPPGRSHQRKSPGGS